MNPHTPFFIQEVLTLTRTSEKSADAAASHEGVRGEVGATPVTNVLMELVDAAARAQTTLREAQADSPTIASDPCVVLLTGRIGNLCEVDALDNSMDGYNRCTEEAREWLTDTNGKAQRARAADAAQGGACNLTPLARSLHKAVAQVIEEGGAPQSDPAVRLIAHQMAFLTGTNGWDPDGVDAQRMRAMVQAQLARTAVMDAIVANESLGVRGDLGSCGGARSLRAA